MRFVELNAITTQKKPSGATATFRVHGTAHEITFQIDTGTQCNVISFSDYVTATGDENGANLLPTKTVFIMHNKATNKPKGTARLVLERNGKGYDVFLYVVQGNVVPLLSLPTSKDIGLIEIKDCDHVTTTPKAESEATTKPITDPILKQYADVFTGLVTIPGEYSIQLNPDVAPHVISPRRVPIALQDAVEEELDRLISLDVIAPVTDPTDWVNSMVAVRKSTGKVLLCIDPPELNKVIKLLHYQLPTFDDIASRLQNAKVYSVVDAKTGFWQVKLDTRSSYYTTLNTPRGRYLWLRMPFGIASAPEEWQRRMHEIIEGLNGVQVIADDFLIIGSGSTTGEAIRTTTPIYPHSYNGHAKKA